MRHPSITEDLYRWGFEIGNHTFTHAELEGLPGWERQLQISFDEPAIGGGTGIRPRLVRPPYSSTPDAVTPQGTVTDALARVVGLVTLLVRLRMLAGLLLARRQVRRVRELRFDPGFTPAVSVLVPRLRRGGRHRARGALACRLALPRRA